MRIKPGRVNNGQKEVRLYLKNQITPGKFCRVAVFVMSSEIKLTNCNYIKE